MGSRICLLGIAGLWLSSASSLCAEERATEARPVRVKPASAGSRTTTPGRTITPAAKSLIQNGSFEDVLITADGREAPKGWSLSAAWFAEPKDKGLAPVSLDETNVYRGARAACITGRGNRGMLWQAVTKGFKPGDTLELSGWIKREGVEAGASIIRVECKQGNKELAGFFAHSAGQTTSWKRVTARGRVPENTDLLFVGVFTAKPNTGRSWFDDVELRRAPVRAQTAGAPREADTGGITSADCVIPLDDLSGPELRFASRVNYYTSFSAKANEMKIVGDNGRRFLQVKYEEDRCVSHAWDYLGEWTALCFRARRAAGKGGLMVTLFATPGGLYNAGTFGVGTEWKEFLLRGSDFKSDRRRGEFLSDSTRQVTAIAITCTGKATVDLGPVRLASPQSVGIREVYTDNPTGVFAPGSAPMARVALFNTQTQDTRAALSYALRNYRGTTLVSASTEYALAPRSYGTRDIALPKLGNGYYSCEFSLTAGKELVTRGLGILVMPPRPKTANLRPFVGATHHGDLYPRNPRLWIHRAEVAFVGPVFDKNSAEDMPRLQGAFEQVRFYLEQGITPIGNLGVTPDPWWLSTRFFTKSESDPGKWVYKPGPFGEHAYRLATLFRDTIKIWYISGELDQFLVRLEGGEAAYVAMVRAAARGIRRAIPDARVYSIGVAGPVPYQNWALARSLWKELRADLDGIYSDNYPSGWTVKQGLRHSPPESFLERHLRQALDFMGQGKAIGVAEAGYQLDPKLPFWHHLTRTRAECAARSALIAAGIPRAEQYLYYHLNKRTPNSMWGMALTVGGRINPGPGLATYSTVARMLWDATEPSRLKLHQDIWSYVYRKRRGAMAVLWTTAGKEVVLALDGIKACRICDADGADLKARNGQVSLSGSPVYFCVEDMLPTELAAHLKKARYTLPPVKIGFVVANAEAPQMLIVNQTRAPLSGKAELRLQPVGSAASPVRQKTCRVPVEVNAALAFPLSLPGSLPAEVDLIGTFTTDQELQTVVTQRKRFWPVSRLRSRPTVDGDVKEYEEFPAIVLDKAKNIFPPDAVTAHNAWGGPEEFSARAWTTWDDAFFYLAAEVTDIAHAQEQTLGAIWANDAVHLGFDMANDTLDPQLIGRAGHDGKNDFEIGLALTKAGPQAYEWFAPQGGREVLLEKLPDMELAIRRQGHRTLYELAIPWEDLGGYGARLGNVFGFSFVVMNSNDGSTARYWLGLTRGICAGKDPSLYDGFVLVD